MRMSQGKFSTPVFVLSIVCAFLIGIIGGYLISTSMTWWRYNSMFPETIVSSGTYEHERPERRDIVFHEPGADALWNENYEQIPTGNGEIRGKIFIDDKPAQDLEFSLLLADGRTTPRATVDLSGSYTINIPTGKYFFNGILIHNKSPEINDKFLINQISRDEGTSIFLNAVDNEAIQEEYSKLEKEIGADEAAKKILEGLVASTPFDDRFPFELGDTPFTFPDFHYRRPITILSPAKNPKIPLTELQFIWQPVERASNYKAIITKIEKKGSATSYSNAITLDSIDRNQISYSDLAAALEKSDGQDGCKRVENLQENQLYGFRVIAYDSDEKIITASSASSTNLSLFSVSK